MSILRRALSGAFEKKIVDASMLSWPALFGWPSSKAGVAVNVDSALRVMALFACVRVISEDVAKIPFKLYRERADGGKDLAKSHPLYSLLGRKPNDWQTSFEWREGMLLHALLCEGGYSIVSRSEQDGRILEFIPLVPGNVRVVQDRDYSVKYEISDADGQITRIPKVPAPGSPLSVMHLRGPSWNGFAGMEVVRLAREALGLSIASEENLARLYSNGARPSGLLSTDNKLTKEQLERIQKSFQDAYAGLQNAFKTIVLDAGMKFSQMSMSPAETQALESRRHQIEEICRALRVFPQMIGFDGGKSPTYASAEQFFLAHVSHTLMPWFVRFEQVIDRDCLTDAERAAGYFAKFNVNALLRGDAMSRSAFYKNGINDGWMTRNEARANEDYNPIDGLDEPLQPLNMMSVAQANAKAESDLAAAKAAAEAAANPPAPVDAQPPSDKKPAEQLSDLMLDLERKVGRILSSRNEGKLRDARDLIDEVIQQVDQEE